MESYIGAAPSSIISQLDFSLQSTAPYIIQRRSVRMYPSSASTFTSNGVNVCRITLASEGEWADLSTLRFVCTVQETGGAAALEPYSVSPSSLFQRVRELCGGTVISDVLNYARTCEMFQSKLEPSEWQFSEGTLGFGGTQFNTPNQMIPTFEPIGGANQEPGCPAQRHPQPGLIRSGTSYTCLQRLLTGMVKANKLIPLRVCPLTYELTLETPANVFNPAGSQAYSLTNCYILVDLLTLDSSIQNSYMKMLLGGAALACSIPQYITIQYNINNARSLAIVVQRALTRNVAVFVNFQAVGGNVTQFAYPDAPLANHVVQNLFVGGVAVTSPQKPSLVDGTFSFQLQLGSKLWPEQPMASQAEMYETLRKAVGTHNQDIKNISVDRYDYLTNSFILGIDLEKNLGDPFSAQNTRAGDVLRLVFNGIDPASNLNNCYVTLIGSSIAEIRETGVFVFE
jgi:hypothetical protein